MKKCEFYFFAFPIVTYYVMKIIREEKKRDLIVTKKKVVFSVLFVFISFCCKKNKLEINIKWYLLNVIDLIVCYRYFSHTSEHFTRVIYFLTG